MSDLGARTHVEAIEEAFAAACARIPDVKDTRDHEPDIDGIALPAVTLFWTTLSQDDTETGPYTDNTWTWDVNVYTPLEIGYRDAQRLLKRIVTAILAIVREDPALSEHADRLQITDGGTPEFDNDHGTLRKTLRLTATTTER